VTHLVGVHNWRRTARKEVHRLERWQGIANGDEPPLSMQAEAQRKLDSLGVKGDAALSYKRAISARRGRWEVIASRS
jgi:hypothetical protein